MKSLQTDTGQSRLDAGMWEMSNPPPPPLRCCPWFWALATRRRGRLHTCSRDETPGMEGRGSRMEPSRERHWSRARGFGAAGNGGDGRKRGRRSAVLATITPEAAMSKESEGEAAFGRSCRSRCTIQATCFPPGYAPGLIWEAPAFVG